jgi:flagellar hook-associated protein 1 FlgK
MSSLFYSLEIAKTGLYVSQHALTLTGNNISNANTKGYTRQRIVVESIDPSVMSRFKAGLKVGGGAALKQIDQIRSAYIDRQLRGQYSALGQWNTRSSEFEFIKSILNETSDTTSISSAILDFYSSLSKLTTNPADIEVRTNVQQNSIKLCETLNYSYDQLVNQQNSYNDSMLVTVNQINNLSKGIADYNKQVYAYELSGQSANELRDQRALLVDELSQLVNIEYTENANGELTITTQGQTLVDHNVATLLEAVPELTGAVSGETGYYEIYLDGETDPFEYSEGELKAYKDLRDGTTAENMGIPFMLSSLNTLARSLAQEFNAVHRTGHTIPYGGGASLTNVDFFNVPAGGYADITAGNIALSDAVLENERNIAASDSPIDLTADDTQVGNNKIALLLYKLTSKNDIPTIGSFDEYLKSFVVQVGIAANSAKGMSDSQTAIVGNLETRKESISGVSIDDEMVNIIAYQHSYAAAARVMTAIDDALSTLINNTGRVGL